MSDEVEFRCFRDNELMIPEDCAKMIIHHVNIFNTIGNS